MVVGEGSVLRRRCRANASEAACLGSGVERVPSQQRRPQAIEEAFTSSTGRLGMNTITA
jgi:hypothetical protein